MAIQNFVPTDGIIDSDKRRTSIRPIGKEFAQIRPSAVISIIVAVDLQGAIGLNGDMLWHISPDLRRFKAITSGKTVIMGRKTWESLPHRPLPDRLNIVITRQHGYNAPGAICTDSLERAIGIATSEEIFIIGGGELYARALPFASRLYLTRILDKAPQADTFFPHINPQEWTRTEMEAYPASNSHPPFRFENYVRCARANTL